MTGQLSTALAAHNHQVVTFAEPEVMPLQHFQDGDPLLQRPHGANARLQHLVEPRWRVARPIYGA